jgi:2-methylcitrate dehydratase PrpD
MFNPSRFAADTAVRQQKEPRMMPLTAGLAEFSASIRHDAIPQACLHAARIGFIDCVGVMIAGSREQAHHLVANLVAASATNEGAPEIPSGRNLAPADAALVNGVAAHVLDYDDVAIDGHPSAALVPAILAEGWALDASGEDALVAYIAGYEVWAQLQELEPGHLHERGFHPTAIWGTLAAAAACARLNRLDPAATGHALAIAASLAAGLVANFGTMTKPLHVGRTAQAGVLAARLAKAGFTGSPDALEHPTGFMQAHSASGKPSVDARDWRLGKDWRLSKLGVNVKRYPMCYATHRSIDAMLDLVCQNDLAPDAVDEIRVRIGSTQRLMLRNRDPKTALEAKFSLEFAMAAALVARHVGLAQLADDFVRRADVIDAMRKVRCTTTDEILPDGPFAPEDKLSIVLKSGETLAHPPVSEAKGSWKKPLSDAELRDKFFDCAAPALGSSQADDLFDRLAALDRVASLRELPLVAMKNQTRHARA